MSMINTLRILLMPCKEERYTKMIRTALQAALFDPVEYINTGSHLYDGYNIIEMMQDEAIDIVLWGSVTDVARDGREAQLILQDIRHAGLYPMTCNVPPTKIYPKEYQTLLPYGDKWDFVKNLSRFQSIPGFTKRLQQFETELQRQYAIYLDRCARAQQQGFGHKTGETIVHHDKAEKMAFLAVHHKAMGGTMTGREIIQHFRSKGKTISYHTMSKYIAELKEQPLKK